MEASGKIDSIIGGLDADSLHQLESQQANFDKSFQSGNNANNFAASVNMANNILSGKIIALLISTVTSKVSEHLAEATAKAATPPDIVGMAAKLLPSYITSPDDIMKELLMNKDQVNEQAADKNKEDTIKEVNDTITKEISKITNKIKEKIDTDKITSKVESILKYSAQGAQWVDSQLTQLANMTIKSANEEIDNTVSSIQKIKEKMAENLADKFAKQEAEKKDKKVKEQTRKKLMDAEKSIKSAKLKAMANSAKAISKTLAMLGV